MGEVVQERIYKSGAVPGITSREILSRRPACPTKWKEPTRVPTEEERRRMLGIMVEFAINMCMAHHFYMHKERVKRQGEGAGIGLRLSEALGRAFGLDWDDKLLTKLERLDWKPKVLKRYVDDLNTVVVGVKPGTRGREEEEETSEGRTLVQKRASWHKHQRRSYNCSTDTRGRCASLATRDKRESAGGQEWATRTPA